MIIIITFHEQLCKFQPRQGQNKILKWMFKIIRIFDMLKVSSSFQSSKPKNNSMPVCYQVLHLTRKFTSYSLLDDIESWMPPYMYGHHRFTNQKINVYCLIYYPRFYSGDQDRLFKEAHLISPNRNLTRQSSSGAGSRVSRNPEGEGVGVSHGIDFFKPFTVYPVRYPVAHKPSKKALPYPRLNMHTPSQIQWTKLSICIANQLA